MTTTWHRYAVYTLTSDGVADWSINDGESIEEVISAIRHAGASWTPPVTYLDIRARLVTDREAEQVNTDAGCEDWVLAMEDDLRHCVRCGKHATWIVGFEDGFDEIFGVTNDVCDAHLAEASRAMTNASGTDATDATGDGDIPGRLTIQRLPFDV